MFIQSTRGPVGRTSRTGWITSVQADWFVRILKLSAYPKSGMQ